ncbi:hypothetical protein ACSTHF_23100, partial [Vibrio parahaemolyticus]
DGAAKLTGLPALASLDLGNTKLTDKGAKELGGLKAVTTLRLTNTAVSGGKNTYDALVDLKEHLVLLDLTGSHFSPAKIAAI